MKEVLKRDQNTKWSENVVIKQPNQVKWQNLEEGILD